MSDSDFQTRPVGSNGGFSNGLTNGIANGSPNHKSSESSRHKDHKHKSKDKDRDREKDRHKSSHKDKDRDKDRSRDKDRHSSSHKSSHKDKHRDKDRSDRDKDRHRDKERSDKDKSRDRDKEKSRSDKHKDRSKDKERSRDDKDRHRDDKERERRKEKEKERSSGDRKDKDRHSSHKSSHRDKHRESHKEHKAKEPAVVKEEPAPIKQEMLEDSMDDESNFYQPMKHEAAIDSEEDQLIIKEESIQYNEEEEEESQSQEPDEESEDDLPLSARKKTVIKQQYYSEEDDDEDDKPLMSRKKTKVKKEYDEDFKMEEDSEDEKPLIARKKIKTEKKKRKADEDNDFKPDKKKIKKEKTQTKHKRTSSEVATVTSPTKKKKKAEEEEHVWKWWEEEKRDDGKKWNTLEHKGPVFPENYERLPSNVKFYYDGSHMVLSDEAEEVAGFYARMLEHDYTTKPVFNKNFFKDWRKVMTSKEREKIIDLKKCNFSKMYAYFVQKNEDRKNMTKEEKKVIKEKNAKIVDEYGWCIIDGHKQKIGNFKIEPPGLFRGRGEHPKQGMLKKRVLPEEILINCSKESTYPKPPPGRKWKEVRHDPTVTWLACWVENVQGQFKYVMLNAASKLKGEKDWQKYETARRLHKIVDNIRENYKADWKSKEMRIRQRSVALYFIDKLALRAGNEKDEDQADTVGCCSLRVEHISLHEKRDGKEYVVVFDFLGKDSIRYYNEVQVEKRVFKNLQLFMENKQGGDDLFDRLNTQIMNKHLNELMEGLTAKVFRTYNASRTLQEQLDKVTDPDDPLPAKILSYNRANREVAILCNHQRSVPKTHEKSMANLQGKIDAKKQQIEDLEGEVKDAKRAAKHGGSVKEKTIYEKKKKALERTKEQLTKLEISATDKEENKQIALGTSKLNYLDPRISVAWCKKNDIPIEKVYNKTQRQKFQWAIDMATAEFNFLDEPSNMSMNRTNDEEYESEDE